MPIPTGLVSKVLRLAILMARMGGLAVMGLRFAPSTMWMRSQIHMAMQVSKPRVFASQMQSLVAVLMI